MSNWLVSDETEPSNEELGIVPLSGLPLLAVWGLILMADAAALAGLVWWLRTFR